MIAATADLSAASKDESSEKKALVIQGYFWMIVNCASSAAFVIFMRYVIRKTAAQGQFRDFDTVFYNNILTAPMFFLMSLIGADGNLGAFISYYGEHTQERNQLVMALLFSGVSAFWISYASSWCMRVTNSTTYSMVGSLNKLPIAISGLLVFQDTPITFGSVGSIILGFLSGVLYTIAKLRYDQEQRLKSGSPILDSNNRTLPISMDRSSKALMDEDEEVLFKSSTASGSTVRKSSFRSSSSSSDSVAIQMRPLK